MEAAHRDDGVRRNSIPWSLLGIVLHRRKGPWSAEGSGKGIRWGTWFSHRNPMAGDPSAVSRELQKRRNQ